MIVGADSKRGDWVSDYRMYAIAWGVPSLALTGTFFVSHPLKTIIWTAALIWMGVACLANARRCGRRHCSFTGPFFILMAILGTLHGFEVIWLGQNGWMYLAMSLVVIGAGVLWYLPEKIWGKYRTID